MQKEGSFLIYLETKDLLKNILRNKTVATCLHILSTEKRRIHVKYSKYDLLEHKSMFSLKNHHH